MKQKGCSFHSLCYCVLNTFLYVCFVISASFASHLHLEVGWPVAFVLIYLLVSFWNFVLDSSQFASSMHLKHFGMMQCSLHPPMSNLIHPSLSI